MFNELNKGKRTVREGINTKEQPFRKLEDFVGQTILVDGYFFTTGKFGKQCVVVGNGYNINMPKRAVALFEAIDANEPMLKAVLDGKLELIDIAPFKSDKGNDTTTFTLHDRV